MRAVGALRGNETPRLFSYCLRIDDGAAPNPFWGLCTLVICKPVIRRTASEGDWVVGVGSKNTPMGDCSGKVIYAMQVSRIVAMRDYEAFVRSECPEKVPDWHHRDGRRRVGDAVYDFATNPPKVRASVHTNRNRRRDLGGEKALISNHFFYFGRAPEPLPADLLPIVRQGQGHQVKKNEPYVERFVGWVEGLGVTRNKVLALPQYDFPLHGTDPGACACAALEEADENEATVLRRAPERVLSGPFQERTSPSPSSSADECGGGGGRQAG